jgi:hypothetical protein
MREEGVEGSGMQCVQWADTCSVTNWCDPFPDGAYCGLGARSATRGETRASASGEALSPCHLTAEAKNLSTSGVLESDKR